MASRRRRWAPCRSSRTRWCSRSRRTRCARATTRATSRSSPRAARARCSRRRSRSRSGRRGCSCRLPGRHRGARACSRPTWSTSTSRRSTSGSRSSTRAALAGAFEELEEQARGQLDEDGIPADRCVVQRVADCRYLGQGYELRVDVGAGAIDDAWVEKVRADFHDIHEREYSRRFEESDIEIPNIRVRGIGLMPALETPEIEQAASRRTAALRHEGEAWFRVGGALAAGADALLRPRRRCGPATGSTGRRSSTSTTRRP